MRLHWLAVARRRSVQVLHNVQRQDENQQREGLSPGQCPDTAWPISRSKVTTVLYGKGQSKIGSLDPPPDAPPPSTALPQQLGARMCAAAWAVRPLES